MNSSSNVIGFSGTESTGILEWFQELDDSSGESRALVLVSQLGKALESYMGIDEENLSQAFLADYQRKRRLSQ